MKFKTVTEMLESFIKLSRLLANGGYEGEYNDTVLLEVKHYGDDDVFEYDLRLSKDGFVLRDDETFDEFQRAYFLAKEHGNCHNTEAEEFAESLTKEMMDSYSGDEVLIIV